MAKRGWRALSVLLLILLGGMLASAQVGPTCPDGKKADEELVQIASHDLVHELREAAASALASRLGLRILKGEDIPLEFLEDLARSSSTELREKIISPLVLAYWGALTQGELAIEQLISGIYISETHELRSARTLAAMWFLFITNTLNLSTIGEFFRSWLIFPWALKEDLKLERETALGLLYRLEKLMGGGEEELWGYRFGGKDEVIRGNAFLLAWVSLGIINKADLSQLLTQLHPREEWFILAARGATPELRGFTAMVCFLYLDSCAPHDPQRLLELAINGESQELRLWAALGYISRLSDQIILTGEAKWELVEELLMDLALHGESEELRSAAAVILMVLWEGELIPISFGELYNLALAGGTPQLRRAAGKALEFLWTEALEEGKLKIPDIPRRSHAEAHSLEQALIIFAVENTVAHPELARAAIGPLKFIWEG